MQGRGQQVRREPRLATVPSDRLAAYEKVVNEKVVKATPFARSRDITAPIVGGIERPWRGYAEWAWKAQRASWNRWWADRDVVKELFGDETVVTGCRRRARCGVAAARSGLPAMRQS